MIRLRIKLKIILKKILKKILTKANQINASTENKSKENIKINNRDKPEEKDKDKTKNSNHINVIDAKNNNSKIYNNTNEKELEKIEFVPVNEPLYKKKSLIIQYLFS